MNTNNDNIRSDLPEDLIVLGDISIETQGDPGVGEPIGRLTPPGIAED